LMHASEKGNDKEDHFNYLHIVKRDNTSLEDLFLGLVDWILSKEI
jgi:hypothetical protein